MKSLVLVLSLLVAGTAFAGTDFSNMTISELAKSGKYDLDFSDKVLFQKASWYVESFSKTLCTDGTFIYGGTRTLEVCVSENDGGNCNQKAMKTYDLVQPIVSERQRCAAFGGGDNNQCTAWETVVFVQSPNRKIKILAANGSDNNDKQVVGVKNYTIPACGGLKPVPAN